MNSLPFLLADTGHYALITAFLFSVWAVAASLLGASTRSEGLLVSGRRALYVVCGLVGFASLALVANFLADNFALDYVRDHSSSTLPPLYKVAALWAGQAGSLLLWALILSLYIVACMVANRRRNPALMPWVTATLSMVSAYWLSLVVFAESPFRYAEVVATEGAGLNPQLQNYWQAIHPPSLYAGYIGWTIPFAFAIAALATGRLGREWIATVRRWSLFAWFMLTLGILFGSRWAYVELGWGGYWAWDPVENASFMPWLTGTAFLHSIMIQERKEMLKIWNMVLVLVTFALSIFGTLLTRTGLVDSVHTFAMSNISTFLAVYLGTILFVSVALVVYRLPELRAREKFVSPVSREAAFLGNNLVLVVICFAVLLGTLFPVLSEWARGTKVHVGPPFFDKVTGPLFLFLLFLMGVGPLIAWRKASLRSLRRSFRRPLGLGLLGGVATLALGIRDWQVVATFAVGAFVLATIGEEFLKGVRVWHGRRDRNWPRAAGALVSRNTRRWGGYLVHIGVILAAVGIIGTETWQQEKSAMMSPGESMAIAGYDVSYEDARVEKGPHRDVSVLLLDVRDREGAFVARMEPERSFWKTQQQPVSEVSIYPTLAGDLYAVNEFVTPEGRAKVKLFWNPLIGFLWAGGFVIAIGTVLAGLPGVRPRLSAAGGSGQTREGAGEPESDLAEATA